MTEPLTTGRYLTDWISQVRNDGSIRPTTAKAYEVAIRVHIIPRLGRVPLELLSRAVIRDLYAALSLRGRSRGPVAGLSVKAVHNIHLTLHRALGDAVDDGLLTSNPAHRAHRLGSSTPVARTWTAAELREFLCEVRQDRDYPLWRLGGTTGMRRGELLGLCWSDVDFAKATVAVQRQLVRNGDRIEFGNPKTAAGRRTVYLDPETLSALVEHKQAQGVVDDQDGRGYQLVFIKKDGRPRDPDSVSQRFARLVRLSGLPHIRLHDLRHTHASLALVAGINPKVVQERLGHASVQVTLDTYTHVIPPMHKEAASLVAALIDEVRDHS